MRQGLQIQRHSRSLNMTDKNTIMLNGKSVAIGNEKNLLEVIRKANITLD